MVRIGYVTIDSGDINPLAGLICLKLCEAGYEAYIVGGCVRDLIIGRKPKDWDICTSASPEQVTEVFSSKWTIVPTGLKHGTVTLVDKESNQQFEVTTYRIDGQYSDGRHPDGVTFTKNLIEDLSRRDFTMNAIALGYNTERGYFIEDPFGGCNDIERRVIRCVGNASNRFQEDALRMMRAIRFACQLNFNIDQDTLKAIKDNSNNLTQVSFERIRDEFVKIMESDRPHYGIIELQEVDLLKHIIPELCECIECTQSEPWHLYNVFDHIIIALKEASKMTKDLETRLAVLYHDTGKPLTKSIDDKGTCHFYEHPVKSFDITQESLRRLRFDNAIINCVSNLVLFHDHVFVPKKPNIKRLVGQMLSIDLFPKLITIRIADIMAQNPDRIGDRIDRAKECLSLYDSIIEESEALTVKDLKVNGHDVMSYGFKGTEVGEVLRELLDSVRDEKIENDREKLLSLLSLIKITKGMV